jgi:long-chain acyl-CoA synthetase
MGKTTDFGKGSVEISPAANAAESGVRRLAITRDELVTRPFEGIATAHDIIEYAARTHGEKPSLGWRDIVDIHEEAKEVKKSVDGKEVTETKTWKYFQLSDYKYLNFVEVKTRIEHISRGLVELGVGTNDVFNVYAQTRWLSRILRRISH